LVAGCGITVPVFAFLGATVAIVFGWPVANFSMAHTMPGRIKYWLVLRGVICLTALG